MYSYQYTAANIYFILFIKVFVSISIIKKELLLEQQNHFSFNWVTYVPIMFLLMEDPEKAYELSKTLISDNWLSVVVSFVLNGREKEIDGWDFKVLCAFSLIMKVTGKLLNFKTTDEDVDISNLEIT